MPKANWATEYDRIKKWQLYHGNAPGLHYKQPRGDVPDALQKNIENVDVLLKFSTNDAANQNACIAAAEQESHKEAQARHLPGRRYRANADIHCQSHQSCLTLRPIYTTSMGDYSTVLVRLGHLLQNGSKLDTLLACVDRVIDRIFVYRVTHALPPEAAGWRAEAKQLLELTNSNNHLSADHIDEMLEHDNGGPWRSTK